MKIRNGFVTNSSSSSFILAFNNDDKWSSYEHFKEECDYLNYNEFYDLIHDISSDYLTFSNNTKETISIKPLIDRIKNIDFGSKASNKLTELYEEDYQLKPYEYYSIIINDLENNEINLDEINFKDIYEDDYSIDIVRHDDNRNKEESLNMLYNYYHWNYNYEFFDSLYPELSWKERQKIKESEEFKEKVKTNLEQNKEYLEKKKQIEESDLIVNGMIWDTDGGLLEWSIRNGFIKNNFRKNHVITWNVG